MARADTAARVFVYGLLKPGQRLHDVVLPYLVSCRPAVVAGTLYDAGLPAARFGGAGEIDGYVLELTPADEALRVLDDLEDEGVVYRRVCIRTLRPDLDAFAYEYLPDVASLPRAGRVWR